MLFSELTRVNENETYIFCQKYTACNEKMKITFFFFFSELQTPNGGRQIREERAAKSSN